MGGVDRSALISSTIGDAIHIRIGVLFSLLPLFNCVLVDVDVIFSYIKMYASRFIATNLELCAIVESFVEYH